MVPRVVEEIGTNGFDNFSVIDWEKAQLFLGFKPPGKEIKDKPKKKRKTKGKKKKSTRGS